jgi:hypothetical protein
MAEIKNTAPREYVDVASHIGYCLYELGYFAQATRAMLEEFEDRDWSMDDKERLAGVGYMLTRACSHYRSASAMRATVMKAANMASSLS